MFFITSKLFWFLAAPGNLVVLLGFAGLAAGVLKRQRLALWLYRASAIGLLLIWILPLGPLLLTTLENRFPQAPASLGAPIGIIVLGGASDETITAARGRVSLNEAAERLTEAVRLSRLYPQATLIFSGGSGALVPTGLSEASVARQFWTDMGVDPARIVLEGKSRNTTENAAFTAALIRDTFGPPTPDQRWLLVTSAFHMPRSVGLFRKVGLPVVPYPVDYRTRGTSQDLLPHAQAMDAVRDLDLSLREWVGLAAYWATGRIDDIFPGP